MAAALALAREAAAAGEIPVGCVITDGAGSVIGRGRNRREEGADATAHAEIEAIREACRARRKHKCHRVVVARIAVDNNIPFHCFPSSHPVYRKIW